MSQIRDFRERLEEIINGVFADSRQANLAWAICELARVLHDYMEYEQRIRQGEVPAGVEDLACDSSSASNP